MLDFCNVKSHHLQLKTIIIMLIRNSYFTIRTCIRCLFIWKQKSVVSSFTCITSHVYSHHYTSSLENATTNGRQLIHRRFGSVVNYISFIVIHVVSYIVLGLFLPNSSTGCVCSILKYWAIPVLKNPYADWFPLFLGDSVLSWHV